MFKVGQKVVCIEGHSTPCGKAIFKDEIYTVTWVGGCCQPLIKVGIIAECPYTRCTDCRSKIEGFGWALKASRFTDLLEYEAHCKSIESILETVELVNI